MIGEIFYSLNRISNNILTNVIDHVLGRPSVKFRKYQVLLVLAFWSTYLYKYAPWTSRYPEEYRLTS